MFTRWGAFVYRRRRWLALLAIVVAGGFGSLAGSVSSHLTSGGWLDPGSESAQVSNRLEKDFGAGRTSFVALFQADDSSIDARSASFQAAVTAALAPVQRLRSVTGITGYAQTQDDRFISTDGHKEYVLIGLDVNEDDSIKLVDPIK